MALLAQHTAAASTKMLLLGDSGSGKTGALVSLVKAGYNLRIVDFDNGLDVLSDLLTPEEQTKVSFVTCTDEIKTLPNGVQVMQKPGWGTAMTALSNWPDGLGDPNKWGDKDVLVIDSLTLASKMAMNYVLHLNGRFGNIQVKPFQSDWGQAMQLIENLLGMLYSTGLKCNVIVISHIVAETNEEGNATGRYFPSAIGAKLPPKIGRYFNSMLRVQTIGQGIHAKRVIKTVSDGQIELKNSAPTKVPAQLPQATGLPQFFALVRGAGNSASPQQTK